MEAYYSGDGVEIYCGDCREILPQLESESVHCVVTSPPYWGLRDYGVESQIGLEPSPDEYIEKMVSIFRDIHRILRPDGTLWLNMGDSYFRDPKKGDRAEYLGLHKNIVDSGCHRASQHRTIPNGFKPKDLVGIPWMLAFALRADGWYLRQDIIWHKPNPMPESVTDRCTKAHEYIFLLSKSERYYFDQDAIKEPVSGTAHARGDGVNPKAKIKVPSGWATGTDHTAASWATPERQGTTAPRYVGIRPRQNESFSAAVNELVFERNKRSVWTVATCPFPEAHFATFPPDLIQPCILAGAPPGGLILDPFTGSGTTAVVAQKFGRRFIGCELNESYCAMAAKRFKQKILAFAGGAS